MHNSSMKMAASGYQNTIFNGKWKKAVYLNEDFELFSFLLLRNIFDIDKINIYFTVSSLEAICEVVLKLERIRVQIRFTADFFSTHFQSFCFREIF